MQIDRPSTYAAAVVLMLGLSTVHASAGNTLMAAAPASDTPLYSPALVTNPDQSFGLIEVRVGGALSNLELLPYLWFIPDLQSFSKSRTDSIQFDALVNIDAPWLNLPWGEGKPRLSVGGMYNLGGYENLVHLGVDYQFALGDSPFYLEAGAGIGLHDGYVKDGPAGFHKLGCPVLAHWKAGIGWNVTDRVTATIDWQHMSGFVFGCHPNQGLNHIGLVVGYKF